ncbi:MAG: FHA domain-containing protein [Prevotella sp.]|nr:FHA domain-containing protein [Prevotella sp.]
MIICPSCREEIEEQSYYCDQCGQALLYCSNCGRVGIGRRCTYCGGLMESAEEQANKPAGNTNSTAADISRTFATARENYNNAPPQDVQIQGIPTLTLYNSSLNIRMVGINGAIIGRKQGPYQQLFDGNMYISSVHAQLIYKPDSGWCIIDKHSSNGTKLNQRDLLPDIPMSIKSGDIVSLANINLQVSVS